MFGGNGVGQGSSWNETDSIRFRCGGVSVGADLWTILLNICRMTGIVCTIVLAFTMTACVRGQHLTSVLESFLAWLNLLIEVFRKRRENF